MWNQSKFYEIIKNTRATVLTLSHTTTKCPFNQLLFKLYRKHTSSSKKQKKKVNLCEMCVLNVSHPCGKTKISISPFWHGLHSMHRFLSLRINGTCHKKQSVHMIRQPALVKLFSTLMQMSVEKFYFYFSFIFPFVLLVWRVEVKERRAPAMLYTVLLLLFRCRRRQRRCYHHFVTTTIAAAAAINKPNECLYAPAF